MANSLSVSGNPSNMVISTAAAAGSAPTSVTDGTTTYTIVASSGGSARGVTGALSAALPAGVTLTVTLAACGGGTSYGPIVLTTTAQNLVHGISTTSSGCTASITYVLSATAAAGVVALTSNTVNLSDVALP